MGEIEKFLRELIKELDDCDWRIVGITEYKLVEEFGETYAETEDGSTYEDEINYYLAQYQDNEDSYYGTILYPIKEGLALKINYSM